MLSEVEQGTVADSVCAATQTYLTRFQDSASASGHNKVVESECEVIALMRLHHAHDFMNASRAFVFDPIDERIACIGKRKANYSLVVSAAAFLQ